MIIGYVETSFNEVFQLLKTTNVVLFDLADEAPEV